MKKLILSSCVALCAAILHAETFVWTGAEDAYWTNPANWKVEKVGGGGEWETATRCPGAVKMADTDAMWAAMDADTDTAVFDGTGINPTVGYIDLDGHLSVKNVIFRGADAPAYVFGKTSSTPSSVDAQRLALPPSGTLTLEATLGTAPVMTTGLCIVQGGQDNSDATAIQLVNNSAVEFDLGPHWGKPMRRTAVNPVMHVKFSGSGAGGFAMGGHDFDGDYFNYFTFSQNGPVRVYGGIGTASGFTVNKADGTEMTFNLEKNGVVWIKQHGWATFTAQTSARFTGAGIFRTYDSSSGTVTPSWSISSGKAVTIDCQFSLVNGGGQFWNLNGSSGKIVFTADMPNTSYTKPTQLRGGTLETAKVGTAGEGSPLGTGAFFFGNASRLAYTGAGETGDRTLFLTNFADTAGNATGRLIQRGTGAWTLGGVTDLSWSGKVNTLTLENDTEFEATIASPLANGAGTLAVIKTGAGKWTVSGANAYTGATTLEGGTLALDATQTIASLVVNGDAALAIADGATVTVASLTRTTGTLDVQTTGTGKLVVQGAPLGASGSWLTINGESAVFQADGSVTPLTHTWVTTTDIPARGGVVPATVQASDVVGITSAGEPEAGPITLAGADGATLGGLVQKTATPATVHLDASQTLSLSLLALQAEAKDLTVGDSDAGTLTTPTGTLTLDANDPDAALVIRTPLAAAVSRIVKNGVGAARVPLGATTNFAFDISDGSLALATEPSALTLAAAAQSEPFAGSAAVDSNGALALVFEEGADASVLVTGSLTRAVSLRNKAVDLVVSDAALDVKSVTVGNAVAGTAPTAAAQLLVTNAALNGGSTANWRVGDAGAGVLAIEEGVAMTNSDLSVGGNNTTASGIGAVYHRGGTSTFSTVTVGCGHYGYLEALDGTLKVTGSVHLGSTTGSGKDGHRTGSGIFAVYGGTFDNYANTYHVIGSQYPTTSGYYNPEQDRMQSHEVYVKKGIYKYAYNCRLNCAGSYDTSKIDCYMGRVVLSVNGPEAEVVGWGSCCLGSGVGSRGTYVNLNGGIMKIPGFDVATKELGPKYLNFNGGTLCYSGSHEMSQNYGRNGFRATVFAGGFTLRHENRWNVGLAGPFRAATGKGVSTIALPDDVKNMEFIGSPFVEIEGDGEGALGFAEFDSRTRRVTAIAVTCPGWDYTWAKAHLVMPGGVTNRADIACSLAPNKRGPFFYHGLGDLIKDRDMTAHLTTSNEFSSVTVLNGSLFADVFHAVPTDADVTICATTSYVGSRLNMTTNAIRFASLSMTGGALIGETNALGRLVVETSYPGTNLVAAAKFQNSATANIQADISCDGEWVLDAADILAGKVATIGKNLTFKPSASLRVTDIGKLDDKARYTLLRYTDGAVGTGLPVVTDPTLVAAGWKTYAKGSEICLKCSHGFSIIVR